MPSETQLVCRATCQLPQIPIALVLVFASICLLIGQLTFIQGRCCAGQAIIRPLQQVSLPLLRKEKSVKGFKYMLLSREVSVLIKKTAYQEDCIGVLGK